MKIKKSIKWASLIFFISVSIIAAAFLVIRANAQYQTIDDLNTLLKEKGIPIKSIITTKQIPFVIKISLQSKSEDKNLQPEDLYSAQIARKAATLFYRHGQKIDGYELEIINSKGTSISWELNNIFPGDISQQTFSANPSKLSDQDTTSILQSELKLHGLAIDKINVSSDLFLGDSGHELKLQLLTSNINTANQDMIPFLLSLHDSLDGINSKYGTKITICWVRIFDAERNQLLNYVWDVETRQETSIQAPGTAAWYSVPLPVPAGIKTISPTFTGTAAPSGLVSSYPPPPTPALPLGQTPTQQPYP